MSKAFNTFLIFLIFFPVCASEGDRWGIAVKMFLYACIQWITKGRKYNQKYGTYKYKFSSYLSST